jgi:hypothetical protein
MGVYITKSHVDGQFIREVEKEFNRSYEYLKIEFAKNGADRSADNGYEGADGDILRSRAKQLLQNEIGLSDAMKVSELETALQSVIDLRLQVFRKSSNSWIETKMTREWTLKQQNDHGRELI